MADDVRLAERVPVGAFYRANLEAVEDVRSRMFLSIWLPIFILAIVVVGAWESFSSYELALKNAITYSQLKNIVISNATSSLPLGDLSIVQNEENKLNNIRNNLSGTYISRFEKRLAFNDSFYNNFTYFYDGNGYDREALISNFTNAHNHYRESALKSFEYTKIFLLASLVVLLLSLLYSWRGILQPIAKQSRERALALARAGEFNEDVINSSRVVILILDDQKNIVLANHYSQQLLGWPRSKLVGQPLLTTLFSPPDHPTMEHLVSVARPEDIIELDVCTANGEGKRIAWTATAVRDVSGRERLLVAMGMDVTERARIEKELQNALQNARILTDRLQDEAQQAAALHDRYLGSREIALPGVEGLAISVTSSEVGGDYFDSYATVGSVVALLGDVSGHGLAAGSVVAVAKATVNRLREEGIDNPEKIFERLNSAINGTAQGLRLMTMLCASIDFAKGILRIANAGHQFPYIQWPDGSWELLEIGGLPLGQESTRNQAVKEIEIPVGSRILLISDGWIEEESPEGEPFGYDRLEAILMEMSSASNENLRDGLFKKLQEYCQRDKFEDDLSIMIMRHSERVIAPEVSRDNNPHDLVRVAHNYYAQGARHLSSRISRENIVLMAEHGWENLLGRMESDGIRRIIIPGSEFLKSLDLEKLLAIHKSEENEITNLMGTDVTPVQMPIIKSSDKNDIILSIGEYLANIGVPDVWNDVVTLLIDELAENALYAAPRDARGAPLYRKGEERILAADESAELRVAHNGNILALQVSDSWGTLTPAIFLRRIVSCLNGAGLTAGVGGAGLYLMWRFSDYFHINVIPGKETRITVFLDLDSDPEEKFSPFQFLYRHDIHERNISYA